jgi:riboflavin transporter FmnP
LKNIKLDKGWKYLLYFDFILPALLYVLAFVLNAPKLSILFHSYGMYVINPIPNFQTLTGIVGLLFHLGILGYTLYKRNFKDFAVSLAITAAIAAYFLFEINYIIIRPLNFA